MALGLLAGALAGGGDAVQQNARSRIDELKQTRLNEIQQKYQTSERIAGQEFTAEQNQESRQFTAEQGQVDRDFRAGESAADRAQRLQLAEMQEAGANSRAAAGRNDWQLVPLEGGGYGRYNPRTNQFEEANLPAGADFNGGKLSDRQRAQLDLLSEEAKVLRKKQAEGMEPLTTEERVRLGEIEAQQQTILGGGSGGGDLASALEQTLAGEEGGAQRPETSRESPGEQPSARGLLSQEREQAQKQRHASEHKRAIDTELKQVDEVAGQLDAQRSGGASGDLMRGINQARFGEQQPDAQTLERGQQAAERLIELHDDPMTSDFQKQQIMEQLRRLRDSGIPLNID